MKYSFKNENTCLGYRQTFYGQDYVETAPRHNFNSEVKLEFQHLWNKLKSQMPPTLGNPITK